MELFYGNYESYYESEDVIDLSEQVSAWQSALFEQLLPYYPNLTPYTSQVASHFDALDDLQYGALLLYIVYKEAKKPLPSKVKNMWMEDKLFVEATKASHKTQFGLLIDLPELLLPLDVDQAFEFVDLENEPRNFASIAQLLSQVRLVQTWLGSEDATHPVVSMAQSMATKLEHLLDSAMTLQSIIIIEN